MRMPYDSMTWQRLVCVSVEGEGEEGWEGGGKEVRASITACDKVKILTLALTANAGVVERAI